MSSNYVPPHLRNRKVGRPVEKIQEPKIVESEFPEFPASRRPQRTFQGPSFLEKVSEPLENPYKNRDLTLYRNSPAAPSRFDRAWEFTDEDEKVPRESVDLSPVPEVPVDEWKTVERKIRVKRDRVQEALDNGDAPVEEAEDTAWDEQPEDYETFWDERRH